MWVLFDYRLASDKSASHSSFQTRVLALVFFGLRSFAHPGE
jgi:hypothetical protein